MESLGTVRLCISRTHEGLGRVCFGKVGFPRVSARFLRRGAAFYLGRTQGCGFGQTGCVIIVSRPARGTGGPGRGPGGGDGGDGGGGGGWAAVALGVLVMPGDGGGLARCSGEGSNLQVSSQRGSGAPDLPGRLCVLRGLGQAP